jgi:transcriptional regulator with XRE-family HTH domain
MLGYDISYIGQIERGEKSPTFRTMMSLAEVFGIKVSQLVAAAEKRVKR